MYKIYFSFFFQSLAPNPAMTFHFHSFCTEYKTGKDTLNMFVLLSNTYMVELNRRQSLILFSIYNATINIWQLSNTTFCMRAANRPTSAVWNRLFNIYIHHNLPLKDTVYPSCSTNNIVINWSTESQSTLNFFEKPHLNCKTCIIGSKVMAL